MTTTRHSDRHPNQPPAPTVPSTRPWQRHLGWYVLAFALLVTAAIYLQGLHGGWLFDDMPNIVDNPGVHIHHLSISSLAQAALSSPSSEFRRPLASITFALNYLATGLDPVWWKITNIGIHLLNGLLVFLLARLLLGLGLPAWHRTSRAHANGPSSVTLPPPTNPAQRAYIGVLAALIAGTWMLLPINLTAVLYVVQRMASMANVFVLAGLIFYVLFRLRMLAGRRHGRNLAGCAASLIVFTAVGFTAKETAILLPLYAALIEIVLLRFRRGDGKRGPDASIIVLFVVVLVIPLLAGLAWQLPQVLSPGDWATRDFTLRTRLLTEARVVTGYVRWTLLPTPDALSFYHDNYPISTGLLAPPTTLASMIFLTALLALAVALYRRAPLVALGIGLFFACQLLTGTILPLELVYEHRNYFASFGLILAVVPLLAALPSHAHALVRRTRHPHEHESSPPPTAHIGIRAYALPWALPRYVLLVGLIILWTGLTTMTVWAWDNPVRLAQVLAARNPTSPRAEYSLGRTYIIQSGYEPASPFVPLAYAALERAAALPHSSILPEQALIFMNAHMDQPIKPAWWDSMIAKLKAHDPGVQDESSLAALTKCAREGGCNLSKQRMVEAFQAALGHPHPDPMILAVYGDYAWNVLGDHALGAHLTLAASNARPNVTAYHITLARMFAAQHRYPEVRQQIQALEGLNIGGRLDGSIADLRALLPPSGDLHGGH